MYGAPAWAAGRLEVISQMGGKLYPQGGCSHGLDRRTMGSDRAPHRRVATTGRRAGTALAQQPRSAEWHLVDPADRSPVGGSAGAVSSVPDLPSPLPALDSRRDV